MKNTYLNEAESLLNYLIDVTKDNTLPAEYTDLKENKNYGNVMVDDFGDYIPFVEWMGNLSNKKYSTWARGKALVIIKHFQMPNGLLCTSFKKLKKLPLKTNFHSFDADKMSDASLGINLMYDLTKDKLYLDAIKKFFLGLKENMVSTEGFVYYKFSPLLRYTFSTGKFCGLYIEELVKVYESTGDRKFLGLAELLARPWLHNPFFIKTGLFPFKCTSKLMEPFVEKIFRTLTSFDFKTAMLAKANSNLIFGLTRLQRVVNNKKLEDALNNWVYALKHELLTVDNIFRTVWQENRKEDIFYLGTDHAAIDALLEIYITTKNKKALDLAITVTNGWLRYQSSIGLIAETPYKYDTTKLSELMINFSMTQTNISRLDSQTDFAIVILKIYELTKDKKYYNAAKKIIDGIMKYHKYKNGFVDFVNVKTKEKYGHILETKFLFLLLKLFLLMHALENGKKIYKDNLLKDLIRDR